MSNETVKKFDIMIKLRGDNVYDIYINEEWVASRGSYDSAVDEIRNYIKQDYLKEK